MRTRIFYFSLFTLFFTPSVSIAQNADSALLKIPSEAKGTGFGTQLIDLLTKQLDGQLTYDVSNGTTVSLAFKKAKLR
jgi:two-component sensor histidine kinase